MNYLEEEKRYEIPILDRDPGPVKNELNYLYPGYELIYRGDGKEWVLYHLKTRGGCPSDDLLFLQFVLPGEPGMWLIKYMQERDRGNENFKEWLETQQNRQAFAIQSKRNKIKDGVSEVQKERTAYLDRGKLTLNVNRHGKQSSNNRKRKALT